MLSESSGLVQVQRDLKGYMQRDLSGLREQPTGAQGAAGAPIQLVLCLSIFTSGAPLDG